MLVPLAALLALGALVLGALLLRRSFLDDARSYIDDLDTFQYGLTLDTPARQHYLALKEEGGANGNQLSVALLNRAMAVLPCVEKIERDHRRAQHLARKSYVPRQLVREIEGAEGEVHDEVLDIRAEADRLRPGWSQEVFAQAYQLLRRRRAEAAARSAAGSGPVPQRWSWNQSEKTLALAIPIPPGVERLAVAFEAQACTVSFDGRPMRLPLHSRITPSGCQWRRQEDNGEHVVHIWMEKDKPGPWERPMAVPQAQGEGEAQAQGEG
mmetsp:Transcript_25918/g.86875  ORF Transcript_25918/g.86875 Transcript_25918/m.86875 type:complete len:268 (+) Transcript_25918:87-890(+)